MDLSQQFEEQDVEVSRFDYEDSTQLVADFGPTGQSSVDIVGDTVIVVVDGQHYEVETGRDAQAFISNGVLTIEVNK